MTSPGEVPRYFFTIVLKHKHKTQCLIWPYARSTDGYGVIRSEGKSQRVCRLVCNEIHGKPPDNKRNALHTCGKGHEGCVNPHHLYWGTLKQNSADRIAHGTNCYGSRISRKLTDSKVRKILTLCIKGKTDASISRKFNVSRTSIRQIRIGMTWKHIER